MKILLICGYFTIVSFVRASEENELPEMFKRCKMDSMFDQCMKDAIADAIPKVIKNSKQFGLPEMRPFHIKKMVFESNKNGPVSLRQVYTNVEIPDFLEKASVTDFKFNGQKRELVLSLTLPTLHIEGRYSINGKVLILPIQGSGGLRVKFDKFKARFNMKFEELMKNGETYYHFTSVETFMNLGKMEMHLENLFNGDKALGDSTNQFINENWADIWTEVEPDYSRFFSGLCLKFINKFFETRPIKNIFL